MNHERLPSPDAPEILSNEERLHRIELYAKMLPSGDRKAQLMTLSQEIRGKLCEMSGRGSRKNAEQILEDLFNKANSI